MNVRYPVDILIIFCLIFLIVKLFLSPTHDKFYGVSMETKSGKAMKIQVRVALASVKYRVAAEVLEEQSTSVFMSYYLMD